MKTIMVVDDSASLRQVVAAALAGAGYKVIEACDGCDALSKLGSERKHLIVCDVIMPNMDGISFVQQLKQLAAHRFTPVIMLTTVSQEAKKREGQAAGAKAWIVKPFEADALLDAVRKLVLP